MLKRILFIGFMLVYMALAGANPFLFSNSLPSSDSMAVGSQQWHSISIHYMSSQEVKHVVSLLFSKRQLAGHHYFYDARTRRLLLKSSKQRFGQLAKLIHQSDQPQRQVVIRAKIVSLDKDYLSKLGLSYTAMTEPSSKMSQNQFFVPIFKMATNVLINARINLLQQQGHATVIADPVLFTLDQKSASIESGSEIPYQQSTRSGATSVAFKKAVLRLKITPQIISGQRVLLSIAVNQDGVSQLLVNGEPAIKTQQLITHVLLRNKHTVLLGGIIHAVNSSTHNHLPILNQLPIIGGLFRSSHQLYQRKVLLLLVTPEILPNLN